MINYLYLCHCKPIGPDRFEDRALLSDCFVLGRVTRMSVFSLLLLPFSPGTLWSGVEINQNNEACQKQGCGILPLSFRADWLTSNDLLGENALESHFCPRWVYKYLIFC